MILNLDNGLKIRITNYIDLSEAEKKDVLRMRNHPDVRSCMHDKQEISLQEHFSFIDSLKNRNDKQYFLVSQEQGAIGVIYFTEIDKHKCSIGLFSNLDSSIKRKGTILMDAILKYSTKILLLTELRLEVLLANKRAISLYEKFNFKIVNDVLVNDKPTLVMIRK